MSSDSVLIQIRKRRRAFWLWLPIGMLLGILIIELVKFFVDEPPHWLFTTLNIFMAIIGYVLISRLSNVRCPKCGKSALRASLFFTPLNKLKCFHCDHPLQ